MYDITNYIAMHPGGRHTIIKGAGRESSETFRRAHKSIDAQNSYLTRFAIGRICELHE